MESTTESDVSRAVNLPPFVGVAFLRFTGKIEKNEVCISEN
jgi:hypothetical protein